MARVGKKGDRRMEPGWGPGDEDVFEEESPFEPDPAEEDPFDTDWEQATHDTVDDMVSLDEPINGYDDPIE